MEPYLEDLFLNDSFYGHSIQTIFGENSEEIAKGLVRSYTQAHTNLTEEDMAPDQILTWAFDPQNGYFTNKNINQILQKTLLPSEFKYGWYEKGNPIPLFGFSDVNKESVLAAINARIADTSDPAQQAKLEAVKSRIEPDNTDFTQFGYENIRTNKTGNTYYTSFSDAIDQARTQITPKSRNYEAEWNKMYGHASTLLSQFRAEDQEWGSNIDPAVRAFEMYSGLSESVGGTASFENLMALVADPTFNDMLTDLKNTEEGYQHIYTPEDLVHYLESKTGGAKTQRILDNTARARTISTADSDIAALQNGTASTEVVNRIAQALGVDPSVVIQQ